MRISLKENLTGILHLFYLCVVRSHLNDAVDLSDNSIDDGLVMQEIHRCFYYSLVDERSKAADGAVGQAVNRSSIWNE